MDNNNCKGHILVVPYPIQGHVIPMMKLSESIASHGMKATLVITEHNYKGMVSRSMLDPRDEEKTSRVRLVRVADGLEPDDDRKDHAKVFKSISRVMPDHVHKLVSKAKENKEQEEHDGNFTYLVASPIHDWAPKVAEDIGIKLGLFWTSSPGALASTLMIPDLIKSGVIDQQGTPLKKEVIQLSDIPNVRPTELPWYNHHEGTFNKNDLFKSFSASEKVLKRAKWVMCNWFQDLTPLTKASLPNLLPIGPLLANTQPGETLYPEDSIILTWLDQQPTRSVIYVAFGSLLSFSQTQLNELAHGLELSGRRFLWALRSDMSSSQSTVQLPEGFEARIANCGKLVEWASQEKVLAHPSIACFLTHCGWNSTIESMSYGVPLLCWPCFADQPHTRTCVCEGWKIGISLVPENNNGIISANDVRTKIDALLSRQDLMTNSAKFKETIKRSVAQGGSSFEAMQSFIEDAQNQRIVNVNAN